ncbi:MAG TPA: VOC family protein [Terracidiphilus sp.]|nr:VOC family protein [Terracidiphilus sp.]
MHFNRSVPVDTVLPHVPYRELGPAIAWLERVFGFEEHYRYGDPLSGAQLKLGKACIMVKQAKAQDNSPRQPNPGAPGLTIFIEDVEAHHEHAKAGGAVILEEPHETVYGEFQYAAEDIEGHPWLFSRHAKDLDPAQWGATVSRQVTAPPLIAPMLSVRRGSAAVEFYVAAFGAEVLFRLDDQDSVVAELAVGESRFWVADESPEHKNFSPETLNGSTLRMVLVVADPDAVFQRALNAGGQTVWPVEDQPYGWRVGRLVDPFGHHWEIGKPLQQAASEQR